MKKILIMVVGCLLISLNIHAQVQIKQLSGKDFLFMANSTNFAALEWSDKPDTWKNSKKVSMASLLDTLRIEDIAAIAIKPINKNPELQNAGSQLFIIRLTLRCACASNPFSYSFAIN